MFVQTAMQIPRADRGVYGVRMFLLYSAG